MKVIMKCVCCFQQTLICYGEVRCVNDMFVDHSKGFGGKFGVQSDRVDKSAVGWDHQEKVEKHASQKGN